VRLGVDDGVRLSQSRPVPPRAITSVFVGVFRRLAGYRYRLVLLGIGGFVSFPLADMASSPPFQGIR
jgi:hypothetical protein